MSIQSPVLKHSVTFHRLQASNSNMKPLAAIATATLALAVVASASAQRVRQLCRRHFCPQRAIVPLQLRALLAFLFRLGLSLFRPILYLRPAICPRSLGCTARLLFLAQAASS